MCLVFWQSSLILVLSWEPPLTHTHTHTQSVQTYCVSMESRVWSLEA